MLTGLFNYKGHMYTLEGYDFGDSLDFLFTPVLSEDKVFLDSGIHYSTGDRDLPSWSSLWVNVSNSFVKCDCYVSEDVSDDDFQGKGTSAKPKRVKNSVNVDLLTTFGKIISGMKLGSNSHNMETDGEIFHDKFNPRDTFTHVFPNGKITLKLQLIERLTYEKDDISLELEDDFTYPKQIYAVNKNPHKFKLDLSEYIGSAYDDDDSWDFGDSDKIFSLQEIIERNPNKSYVWLNQRKYYIIKDIIMLERVCKYLWQFKLLAFDTETTGLRVNLTSRRGIGDRLVGMIFSAEPGIAYYIPIAHKKVQNICTPDNEYFLIEKYIRPLLEQRDILCHNGSFDWKVMHNYDICMNLKHDTYILFKVTMGNENPQLGLGLKELTHSFLNRDSFELSDFVQGKFGSNNVKFWDLDEESTKYYACPDCDNLIELYQYAIDNGLLDEYEAHKIYEIEVGFSIVIAYQEYYGHHVAIENIDALVADIIKSKEENYAKMVEIAGHDFNPKSNKDLPKVMYEELGMPIYEYTDTGNPSTGKEARARLLKDENPDGSLKYPFVTYLSAYLDARTLESNFTKQIDKFATEDGLMFSEVNQFLKTGRVSTSNPNYQGYSDVVKKYITPRNGYFALDADYSTVEARIMCSMAGCSGMVKKLENPDTDYHRQKAADMFNVPYELVTKQLRQMSKGVNFGILYGLGDPNLGENLFGTKSPENTRKAAKQKELYYTGMEELRPFTEESRSQGVNQGYSTTYFKRRRYYNKAKTRQDTIMRQSCNARIQGTAADLYKYGMVRLFREIRRRGWVGKFLISAFVHDECFCEVSKSINPFLALKVVREAMMIKIDGWAPLFTGEGVGNTWYEAKKTEIPVQVQEYLTETYADNCPDWWQGDTKQLSKFVVNTISNYKRTRVISYLENEENWGKVLQPTENELAHELLKDIKGGLEVEGTVTSDFEIKDDVLENLEQFCKVFGCSDLYTKANIQRPVLESHEGMDDNIDDQMLKQEEVDAYEQLKEMVKEVGVIVQKSGGVRRLYFRYDTDNPILMKRVEEVFKKNPGDMEVRCFINGEEKVADAYKVSPRTQQKILSLYLMNRNLMKARA